MGFSHIMAMSSNITIGDGKGIIPIPNTLKCALRPFHTSQKCHSCPHCRGAPSGQPSRPHPTVAAESWTAAEENVGSHPLASGDVEGSWDARGGSEYSGNVGTPANWGTGKSAYLDLDPPNSDENWSKIQDGIN